MTGSWDKNHCLRWKTELLRLAFIKILTHERHHPVNEIAASENKDILLVNKWRDAACSIQRNKQKCVENANEKLLSKCSKYFHSVYCTNNWLSVIFSLQQLTEATLTGLSQSAVWRVEEEWRHLQEAAPTLRHLTVGRTAVSLDQLKRLFHVTNKNAVSIFVTAFCRWNVGLYGGELVA